MARARHDHEKALIDPPFASPGGTLCCVSVTVMRAEEASPFGMALACVRTRTPLELKGRRWHRLIHSFNQGESAMQWTTPSFTDMRFGFEITMYIATR